MVGRDFQKSLQPFVAYRFSVFEDNVYVDPSGVLDGSLTMPTSPLKALCRALHI